MNIQRYNKMFAAAVPMIVLMISMLWPESDVTAEDVNGWWEAALIFATPILVFLIPNRE